MSGSIADRSREADHGLAGETLGIAALGEQELRGRLAAGRHRGDPQADALVERFRALPGGVGWSMFERALEHGIDAVGDDAPCELRALLEHASRPPSWLDLDLVDAGATSFWRAGLPALAPSLIYGSLAFGYQYGDLSRPLAATGRLERMASRRLGETARWVLAVTTPGAMAPGGEGWRSSLRVRLVHALVRRHLLDSEWDTQAWGVPLSASAMMATAIGGFAIVPQRALTDVGAGTTAADLQSRTALWRWVGYVMGVPPALLPANWREAERLIETLATFDLGPNDDGPALMHALTHHGLPLEGMLPSWSAAPARLVLTPVIEALVRRWLGEAASDELGVGRTPVVRLVPLARPLVRSLGLVLASGLLGDERRMAHAQIRLVARLLDRAGDPARPLSPARAVPNGDARQRAA